MSESSSILAADFGSVYTRVLLVDVVDGMYRLIAQAEVRSTGGFPAGDVTLGLQQAIEELSQTTGRKLLDQTGYVITPENDRREGVDYFLATASGGRSLRAVLVGLMPDVSIESGLRAMEGTYVSVVDTISLRDNRTDEDKLNALLLSDPDIVFITGGTEDGAIEPLIKLLGMVKTSVSVTEKDARPIVIYAGNSKAADRVKLDFSELTRVFVADNVRPTLNEENLASARLRIGQAFDEYKEAQGSGFDVVSDMSAIGLLPTAQSYRTITRYLGMSREKTEGIVVVDIGSAASTLATYFKDDTESSIRTDIGLGHSAPDLVQSVDMDTFRRWLPFSAAKADLMNYALNKSLRPSYIPTSRDEMYMEHALIRVGIEKLLQTQRPEWRTRPPDLDMVIAAGSGLTATGNAGITALLLLDSIQPHGVTELYADPSGLIAAMGAISYVVPEAVVQLLSSNNLDRIGTVFSVDGTPTIGRKAVSYRIDFDNGDRLEGDINGGELMVFKLPPGRTAKVRVKTAGRNLKIEGKTTSNREVSGGSAGIIIDTRGRPIPLGVDIRRRMLQIIIWYALASGIDPVEIPEDRLQPVIERETPDDFLLAAELAKVADEEPEEKPRRRGLFGGGGKKEKPDKKGKQNKKAAAAKSDDDDIDIDELDALLNDDEELTLDDRL